MTWNTEHDGDAAEAQRLSIEKDTSEVIAIRVTSEDASGGDGWLKLSGVRVGDEDFTKPIRPTFTNDVTTIQGIDWKWKVTPKGGGVVRLPTAVLGFNEVQLTINGSGYSHLKVETMAVPHAEVA